MSPSTRQRRSKASKNRPGRETIYFGPYLGERLAWEYILFLRNVLKTITPKVTSSIGYGTIHYSEIFNEAVHLDGDFLRMCL